MNDLIKITANANGIPTVNARDLYAFLEAGKDFSSWMKSRIDQYQFIENTDYVVSPGMGENPLGGRPTKDYHLTLEMSKELAMVERNERGKQARAYFIECERRAKAIPAVDTTALLGDAASLRHILLGYCEKVIALEATVADLAPRADALNRLTVSDGSLNITDAAKSLQINPKAFFTYLRHESWIYTRAGSADNIAYQDKIRAGYLEHKLTTIIKADGSERTVTQARVTPRGLARLALDFERHAKGGNQDMLI